MVKNNSFGFNHFLMQIENDEQVVPNIGTTSFVPPEIFYMEGCRPVDLNNWVQGYTEIKSTKLCAWSAVWREILSEHPYLLDGLVVVGECNTSITEAQHVLFDNDLDTHYFFFPFNGDVALLNEEMRKLQLFLRSIAEKKEIKADPYALEKIKKIKKLGRELDLIRCQEEYDEFQVVQLLGSCADMEGDLDNFKKKCEALYLNKPEANRKMLFSNKVKPIAFIGVPPIMDDFYKFCSDIGLKIVYNEMGFEYIRLGGGDLDEMANSYSNYSFARSVKTRICRIKKELAKRNYSGIIHYHQFSCHHTLEDSLIRRELDNKPFLTVQGDLPRKCDGQTKLRLEAFYESI